MKRTAVCPNHLNGEEQNVYSDINGNLVLGQCGCEIDYYFNDDKPDPKPIKRKLGRAKIWCRDCGRYMQPYPYNIMASACKRCELKAVVTYEKLPKVVLK